MSDEEVINVLIPFQIIKTDDAYALVNERFSVKDVWDQGTPYYYDEATDPQFIVSAWSGVEVGPRPPWHPQLAVDYDVNVEEVATNERL
jgi:hypothetical protein